MQKVLDIISGKMAQGFADAGYDPSYGRVTVSNRPDLCEYQCNGALAAAKQKAELKAKQQADLKAKQKGKKGAKDKNNEAQRGKGIVPITIENHQGRR